LIVIHTGSRTVGVIADTAREFVSVPVSTIQPPPEAISGLSSKYLEGIVTLGERLVLILKAEELLNCGENQELGVKN
jgi:purine-binding chemotaxis protein CheW